MKVTSARKATGMVVTAVAILALAVGSAFAGTSNSSGGNKLDNSGTNNKYGTDNKKDYLWCGTGFDRVSEGSYEGGWAYDLNEDGYICVKYADGQYDFTDNTAHG